MCASMADLVVIHSGVDFPGLLYDLTVNGTVDKAPPAQIGKKSKVPLFWLFAAVQQVLKHDKKQFYIEVIPLLLQYE